MANLVGGVRFKTIICIWLIVEIRQYELP